MKLRLNSPISLEQFTHNKDSRSFVADASDFGNFNFFQRIYDDAADVGFTICNPKSGRSILVTLFQELADYENNEVHGWEFTPSEHDVRLYPLLKNYKFVIFND
ncbi:MAG: hypothetical protein EBT92_16205 [Planctomycetes bacterium]|nr:hypothetical protein [Planctomycetota bacterium]